MSQVIDSIHAACTAQCTVTSPLGPVLLARTAKGLAGVWFEGQKHHPGVFETAVLVADPLLQSAARQLDLYFSGALCSFDLPLDLLGTAFQKAVWQALMELPAGSTCSYGSIARKVASTAAVRAVGGAVGRNPLSIVVPCHRVLGSDGKLTGYAGGMDRKLALLELEQRFSFRALAATVTPSARSLH